MRSPWAREYRRTPETYIWGTEPSSFARRVAALLPSAARVLDLGCGEGRDSVYFAAQGFHVVGVDASRAGIAKARRLAEARGVRVRWLVGDMARLTYPRPFDLIYSCGAIHYVPRLQRARFFSRLQSVTLAGGVHAHVVFTDREVYVEKGEVIDYFTPGELAAAYAGWLILHREEGRIACSQDGTPHHHSVESFIARAPAQGETGATQPSAKE
ncbi:MAG: class I SAM-dependent methyltransferase [Candidatus Rokubacteria bacterium]|nr:class I SAM-dependent methyltransferase [Candidatus Rokubacteria bacterium]